MFVKLIKFIIKFLNYIIPMSVNNKEEKAKEEESPQKPSNDAQNLSESEENLRYESEHSYDKISVSKRKSTKYIIVHCSDSTWGNAEEIHKWHVERGFNKIGYHFVILNGKEKSKQSYTESRNGIIETGREINEIGSHAYGYNSTSIGICLIGKTQFTEKQFSVLRKLIKSLQKDFDIPNENVIGHYETSKANGKTCPNFDMVEFRKTL